MEIRQIKQQLDILEVAARLGIQINKYRKAKCPFHDDKRPSLQFSKEKQLATCFSGNCNVGSMDVVNLVEKKLVKCIKLRWKIKASPAVKSSYSSFILNLWRILNMKDNKRWMNLH